MTYRLHVSPVVHLEIASIYRYREDNLSSGAGDRFLKALSDCYEAILANPYGFQIRKGLYRHAPLRRLKYRVVYEVEGDTIFVYQVRHTSRRPSKRFGP